MKLRSIIQAFDFCGVGVIDHNICKQNFVVIQISDQAEKDNNNMIDIQTAILGRQFHVAIMTLYITEIEIWWAPNFIKTA